jgi:hypothetical protein
MAQSVTGSASGGKEIPDELRPILISLGRGLGTVAVYGTDHPSVEQIIDQTFQSLQTALQHRRSVSLGIFNGSLTVEEEPVIARDVPVRTLEKRLAAMKVSHLALTKGLDRNELKKLLAALCSPTDAQMKETLSAAGLSHVEMSDVKYVALRDGEQKTGRSAGGPGGNASGSGGSASDSDIAPVKVSQIVAFLKGEGTSDSTSDIKEMLSDPERLGQMIMEAASVRQMMTSLADGESLADIVVGCLRRTYTGLRKEAEFQSTQGKVNLTKAMMLLEKNVLDKIHAALGAQHPEIDRRIFDAIREMEEEQQFEMLTAHYFDQRRKLEKVEDRLVDSIRRNGPEKAAEMAEDLEISPKDWQKLMIKADVGRSGGGIGMGGGLDMGALALVLEKMDALMSIEAGATPEQIKSAVHDTGDSLNNYANRIETRIQELEGQVELHKKTGRTVEDHAEHLSREDLMEEVSKLTLALLQPLTVVNASVEAALRHAELEIQKDLLNLANESGRRMQALTKRLMTLVGYPTLGK